MKKLQQILLVVLMLAGMSVKAQQNPLVEVTTTVTGGHEFAAQLNDVSTLSDRTLIMIRNLNQWEVQVVIEGRLEGGSFSIRTNRSNTTPAHYIRLAPFATVTMTGAQIRAIFSIDNVQLFEGGRQMPVEAYFSTADGSGRIPEGNYNLCFDAYEVDPQVSLPRYDFTVNMSGRECVSLLARVFDPPLLQSINNISTLIYTPTATQLTPMPDGSLLLRWQAPAGLRAGTQVRYQVLMAELIPGDTRDPNQVIQAIDIPSEPLAYYREYTTSAARVVTHQIMPVGFPSPLQLGRMYAVQISAESVDPVNPLPIQNNGRSPVYTFNWGNTPATNVLDLASYPGRGTYMPFRGMPVIVKYGPYSASYNEFQSRFTINHGGPTVNFDRRLPWRPNPLEAQRRATGDPTLDQIRAQHIALSQSATDPNYTYYKYLERGAKHIWTAEVTITDAGTPIVQPIEGDFIAGMDKPVLGFPEHNSRQDTGIIKFRFKTAEPPAMQTLSPFDIVQASRSAGTGSFDINIDEKGVLEVSTSERFDSILHYKAFTINKTFLSSTVSNEHLTWDAVVREVYRNEDMEFHFRDTGVYYWRVRWLKDPVAAWNTGEYNKSDTWKFVIKADGDAVADVPRPSADCATPCIQTYEYSGTPSAIAVNTGETISIGQFTMQITEITGTGSGNTYTGKGVITNFGFIIDRVLVDFAGIKVANSSSGKRVYDGVVKATGGGSLEANLFHLAGASSVGPEGLLEIGRSAPALSVPFGWDQSIDGHKIIAKIDSITFNPTSARTRFSVGYEMPGEFAGHPVVFGADVCIAPGGFREDFDIYLERDLVIGDTTDNAYALLFKGRTGIDGSTPVGMDEVTKFSWDCRGFKSLKLAMEARFSRENIVPENQTNGQVEASGRVSGFMTLMLDRAQRDAGEQWGFIGSVNFPKSFQFTFMPGWGFKVENAIFDFSDSQNDTDMRFPAGYDVSLLGGEGATVDDRLRNTWQGFYLKNITVSAPRVLTEGEDDGGARTAFSITDMLIDKTGLTGYVSALNVAAASENGWRISLDTVQVGIVQTRSVAGRLAGTLGAPFFHDDSRLNYSSMLAIGMDGKVEYNFQINVPANKPLRMKMWQASMKLASSSYLRFSISTARENVARFQGQFSGEIGLDSTSIDNIPGLSMSGIKFENFGFDTDNRNFFTFSRVNRTETGGQMVFSFASPQHTAGDFPLNIRDISLSMASEGGYLLPKLGFVTELTLSDLGFKASLGMNIIGQMQLSPFNFSIRGVEITEIGIGCDFNGFKLEGMVAFYKDHAVFGNGVHGRIKATLPMGIEGRLECRFGTVGNAAVPSSFYDYWYVDGLIKINPGITIFSGFAIYGFGGGAYYHMTMNDIPTPNVAQASQSAVSSRDSTSAGQSSGASYVPSRTTGLGFMATVLLGTQPKEDVFNMDITLQAQFSESGGLELIEFRGNGYVMNNLTQRDGNPPVRAAVRFGYYNVNKKEYIQGNFDVFLNVFDVIKGVGTDNKLVEAEIYADLKGENKWWFYMGKDRPIESRCGLLIDLKVLELTATSYIMVGHGIPADLPPLPDFIRDILNGPAQLDNQLASPTNRVRSNSTMQNGQGFAFGVGIDLKTKLNFLMFYASLRMVVGFDANISENHTRVCAETGLAPGFNGWYAQGQAYAGLEGDMGIEIDLFFWKGQFSILKARAAVAMQAKLPNPNYFSGRAAFEYSILEGAVSGRCNFNIELGEPCSVVTNEPLAGLSFINEMKVSDIDNPASVFSNVVTAFNFPVDRVLEVEEMSGGEPVIRRFMPYIYQYKLKKDNVDVPGIKKTTIDNGYLAVLEPDEALLPRTAYTANVELRVHQILPGGARIDAQKDGVIASEIRTLNFTTGDRPEFIVPENVVRTYPIIRQPNYLQGELKSGEKGYVKIKQQDYLFETETLTQVAGAASIPAYLHTFVSVFTPMDGGTPVETELMYEAGNNLVSFTVPTLQNAKPYRLQIIKRTRRNPAALNAITPPYRVLQMLERSKVGVINMTELDAEGREVVNRYETDLNIRRTSVRTAPSGNQVTVLFEYVFSTSRYNTFNEKMTNMQLGSATIRLGIRKIEISSTGEGFDMLEAPVSASQPSLIRLVQTSQSSNTQMSVLNRFFAEFEQLRGFQTKTVSLPSLPNGSSYIYRSYSIPPYGGVAIGRNMQAVFLTRLSNQAYAMPVNTINVSGTFMPLLPEAPAPGAAPATHTAGSLNTGTTLVPFPLGNSGSTNLAIPPPRSSYQYQIIDGFDWYAASTFDQMKRRVNGYLNATLFSSNDITTPARRIDLNGLSSDTRRRLQQLGTTAFPNAKVGDRYQIGFQYQIPQHDGTWKVTSTHQKNYTINN